MRLAKELMSMKKNHTLYLLDEPSAGLHHCDVVKLMGILSQLVNQGNSVIIIEHNLEILRAVDYVIEMGPGGGDNGGNIIAYGAPSALKQNEQSIIGKYF